MLVVKQRRRQNPIHVAAPTPSGKRIMRYLQDAMEDIRGQIQRREGVLLDLLLHSPIDRLVDVLPEDPWYKAGEKIEAELLAEYLDGGSRVKLAPIRKEVLEFSFDRSRPEAAEWARKQSGQLITAVTEDQRAVVRSFVGESLDDGVAPREVARGLRNVVGLTPQQTQWVDNHYQRQIAAARDRGLSATRAAELAQSSTDRYHSRVFRYRTETIARTEILSASHAGRRAAWQQGLQGGWINAGAGKQWSTEVDDRTCDICVPLDGIVVPINGMFPDGEPPVHPNCRCDVLLVDRPDRDLEGLTDAELDDMIDDFLETGIRPGMGDSTLISESDFQAMQRASGGPFITGRGPSGVPTFTAERAALHDEIVRDFLDDIPRSEAPRLDMLGGGPATGKTSQIQDIFLDDQRKRSALVDPDKVKERLPEYARMKAEGNLDAAAFVHEESSYLAKRIQQGAIERRLDIIYDGTGDGEQASLARKIDVGRSNGYTVRGWYATIDVDEAIQRATERAARSGREVPEDTIRGTHAAVSDIFPFAAQTFDEIRLYDTTVRDKPVLIAEGSGGSLRVVQADAYEAFLRKADILREEE